MSIEFKQRHSRQDLRDVAGNDELVLGLYATDASMYQMQPLAVVVPVDREDTLRAIRQCAEHGLPLLARGGGTSLTGQSIGEAVILDVSKNLNHLLELNLEEGWVRVEPGLVCSELNAQLKPYGMHFAPDPATENRALSARSGGYIWPRMTPCKSGAARSVEMGAWVGSVMSSSDLRIASCELRIASCELRTSPFLIRHSPFLIRNS